MPSPFCLRLLAGAAREQKKKPSAEGEVRWANKSIGEGPLFTVGHAGQLPISNNTYSHLPNSSEDGRAFPAPNLQCGDTKPVLYYQSARHRRNCAGKLLCQLNSAQWHEPVIGLLTIRGIGNAGHEHVATVTAGFDP